MRDIRPDLKDRLTALDERMSDLVREYNAKKEELDNSFAERQELLDQERNATASLLAVEHKRFGEKAAVSNIPQLADFLVDQVEKNPDISKDDLRALAVANSYFNEGESGGRAIHTTLLNLVRAKRLFEAADNRYRAPVGDWVRDLREEGSYKAEDVL